MFWGHMFKKQGIVILARAHCFVCSGASHILGIHVRAWARCSVCFIKRIFWIFILVLALVSVCFIKAYALGSYA